MSAFNQAWRGFAAQATMPDPGNAKTIVVQKSPVICNLVSAGAETRTIADPTREGAFLSLYHYTDGGDITCTFSTAFTEDGATTFVFSDVGQQLILESFRVSSSALVWRKVSDSFMANFSKADSDILDDFSVLTATVAEINQHCDESAMTETVTATNVITADESGKTFYLGAAGGFTSTLPAPGAGLEFEFIVSVAPTTAYIIVTTSGANLMYGMMLERAGGAGVAGAARDTFNFVANNAIIGDWVKFKSDGTNWHYRGSVDVAAGNTVAQT